MSGSGRLAVDFGTSNTMVALWDEESQEGVPLFVPDYGRSYEPAGADPVFVIPSVIHYAEDGRTWIGSQVLEQGLYESPRTFRWMKRYISNRRVIKARVGGRELSHLEAGKDFLTAVLLITASQYDLTQEEVAFTVPVEAFEHYENWLTQVAESAGVARYRLIDEPSAAALGYGAPIQPGDVYLIFDFGGGTLDVSTILIEEGQETDKRKCRVLGKAGTELGGMTIDQWLFQHVLNRFGWSDANDQVRALSRELLVACERAKERLSTEQSIPLELDDAAMGVNRQVELTRDELEEVLDEHDAFAQIDRTLRRALQDTRERGYTEDDLKAVLMVGGTSLIPCFQRTLQRIFGRERVMLNRPMDAVARGAAAFIAGVDFFDHIQHDYALRYVDAKSGGYAYHPIVKRGTPYPTQEPVARLTIKGSFEGQTHLGVAIFEVGERRVHSGQAVELIFDPAGAARMVNVSPDELERRSHFWMNEANPTFLIADPPAVKSEPRFETEFHIDSNKRLLISARDLHSGKLILDKCPVVKLV